MPTREIDSRRAAAGLTRFLVPTLLVGCGLAALGCNTTAGESNGPGGRGGRGGRGGGGGSAIHVDTATIQRISVERRVDLSGTLVSLDQARVSSEVAGKIGRASCRERGSNTLSR